ncbi:MAG: hydrolase [Microbacteriaceae bacterium]|jgi:pimeloyl-ACP methyl ester carboxylesterase|nr:hydrolase [Microbacteriaceae bacterium]HEV7957434.1 alpha/beta fold hydrolase [Marisediminicola sp.]
MAPFRTRTTARAESSYRPGSVRGVTFHTSRHPVDRLAMILKRFSGPAVPLPGARSYVLVHGIGVSSRYFHPLAAELAAYGPVYVVDLPGYGLAPGPGVDMSIADHARVLGRFLDAQAIDNPVLVGHSMGGQVVSQLLFDRPEVSDRMVLLGPTMDPLRRFPLKAALALFADMFREPWRSNWTVITDYLFRCGIPYYLAQLPHLLGDRIEERLPAIRATTLVIRGDRDPVVRRDWALQITRLVPVATFAEVPGPHVIMFTAPREVAALIAAQPE